MVWVLPAIRVTLEIRGLTYESGLTYELGVTYDSGVTYESGVTYDSGLTTLEQRKFQASVVINVCLCR